MRTNYDHLKLKNTRIFILGYYIDHRKNIFDVKVSLKRKFANRKQNANDQTD